MDSSDFVFMSYHVGYRSVSRNLETQRVQRLEHPLLVTMIDGKVGRVSNPRRCDSEG